MFRVVRTSNWFALRSQCVGRVRHCSSFSLEQKQLISRIEIVLGRLRVLATDLDKDVGIIKKTEAQIKEGFMVVVVGEFSSGKSQLINALLGSSQCRVGVLPTTDSVNVLKYGDPSQPVQVDGNVHTIFAANPWLRDINIVDTPGTNAILTKHQEITEHFIPRSDLVLFVTSSDRAFSESERQFLTRISAWHKKVLLVLNKKDLLEPSELTQQLVSGPEQSARPIVFAVSARAALHAKTTLAPSSPELIKALAESGIHALETYMQQSLGNAERVRLKLQNPLGVCERLLADYNLEVAARESLLKGDEKALTAVQSDVAQFKSDILADFEHQLAKLENVFLRMLDSADKFLTTRLHISNFTELLQPDSLKQAFEKEVNANVVEDLQDCVTGIMEWFVMKTTREAHAVADFLLSRTKTYRGEMEVGFSQREGLIQELQQQARNVMSPVERAKEAMQMTAEMRGALLTTAAIEVGAVSLASVSLLDLTNNIFAGAGVLSTAALLDWTGLMGASLVAVGGLSVLPYKRARLRNSLRASIMDMQERMLTATRKQFQAELDRALERIDLNIDPYGRFVRAERLQLDAFHKVMDTLISELDAIRYQIEK